MIELKGAVLLLQYLAFFCWGVFSLFVILGLIAQAYRPKRGKRKAENAECVIVSVADTSVRECLFECIDRAKRVFSRVWVLVDEGSELVRELQLQGNSLVVVPGDYRKDLVGKGRALNYFVETKARPDRWYAFLDDDNLILDEGFLYEIPAYEAEGYAVANPVLVPRRGRSTLAFVMDFVRHFDDLMAFRFFTGLLGRPLIGLHGELLVAKGSVLKEIGFAHRSVTEDFRFASEVVRRGYRSWQSATRVSIRSPNSLSDLIRQRGRWFRGVCGDWKDSPLPMKAIVGLRLAIWALGIFGSWALSPLWLFWPTFLPAIPGGVYYWLMYSYGVWKSGRLRYFLSIPLFGVFETLPTCLAGLRQRGFVVIDKG